MDKQSKQLQSTYLNKTTQKAAAEHATLNAPFQHLVNHQRVQLHSLRKAVLLEPGDGCGATSHAGAPTRHSGTIKSISQFFSPFGDFLSDAAKHNCAMKILWSVHIALCYTRARYQDRVNLRTPHTSQITNILTLLFSGTAVMSLRLAYLPD